MSFTSPKCSAPSAAYGHGSTVARQEHRKRGAQPPQARQQVCTALAAGVEALPPAMTACAPAIPGRFAEVHVAQCNLNRLALPPKVEVVVLVADADPVGE